MDQQPLHSTQEQNSEEKKEVVKRSFTQWRPRDMRGIRDKMYNPERDLGYAGPLLIERAIRMTLPTTWEKWLKRFLAANGIENYEDFVATGALEKFTLALNRIIGDENPGIAFEAVGFTDVSPAAQMLLYCRLGQAMLGATWVGVKDTHMPDDAPPIAFTQLLADVNEVLEAFAADPPPCEE